MKKLLILLCLALTLNAGAVTTYSDITIGNFVYNLYAADDASQNYAECVRLSTAGASVTDLTVPGYVTYNGARYRVDGVSAYNFQNNTTVQIIHFGYGITRIGYAAFKGCSNLTRIHLPSSIEAVYSQAFMDCSKLAYVTFAGDKAPLVYSTSFSNTAATKYLSTATYRAANAMKADATWSAAFTNIGKALGFYAYDFETSGVYYTIQNGIPYNFSGNGRSTCTIVGMNSSYGSTLTLGQNISNSANNAPGNYHLYGVADSAFMNNTIITKIVDSNTMAERIGVRAFYGCTNLESAQVRADTIDTYAFFGCSKLASVDMYNSQLGGVVLLRNFAFGNTALTTVTIPSTMKGCGYAPFYNCQQLTTIAVDENNENFTSYKHCLYNKSRIWLYQIPGAANLGTSPQFAPELKRVYAYAGYGNNQITAIALPYGVGTIEMYAFANMSNLRGLHLPSSLTSISNNAFNNDPLTQIYTGAATPLSTSFNGVTLSSIKLTVPYGAWPAYKSHSVWGQMDLNTAVGSWTTAYDDIYDGVGYRIVNGEAEAVYIVKTTNTIPDYVTFQGKNYDVTMIGNYAAFNARRDLGLTVNGAQKVKYVKPRAFHGSTLSNFPFGSSLVQIQDSAFMNTTQMKADVGTKYLTALTSIFPHAFDGSALTSFRATSSLSYIGHDAFARTTSLESVDLSYCNKLTSIPYRAFAQVPSTPSGSALAAAHATVKLPNSVTAIGSDAFRNNILTTFNFPASLKTIGSCAFYNTYIPGEIELPYGVETIENGALSSCRATTIVLPASVTKVHSSFYIQTDLSTSSSLKKVVINTSKPLAFSDDSEDLTYGYKWAENIKNTTVYVPAGALSTWQADKHWIRQSVILEGAYDFTDDASGLKHNVNVVGNDNLEGTVVGRSTIVYNPDVLAGGIKSIDLSRVYTDRYGRRFYTKGFGYKAFMNCSTLTTLVDVCAPTFETIGDYAFAQSGLNKMSHPSSSRYETNYGSTAFLGINVKSIGAYAFHGCKNLHELFLPHIDGQDALTCGNYFFGDNADDFKLWVDYRRLEDFVGLPTRKWTESKVNAHLKLDSEWQSFACVKPINFQSTGVEAYTVNNYNQSEQKANLTSITALQDKNGGVVHGTADGKYSRLNYATTGSTSSWLEGVTGATQTINSTSALSYFLLNPLKAVFDKVTNSTTVRRGYAYLKLNTSVTGGATTITTNLDGGSGGGLTGDVNGDGSVNAADVTALYNYILNGDTTFLATSDVNGDGAINAGDVTAVYNIILGL